MIKNIAVLTFSVICLASAAQAETLCPRYNCDAVPAQMTPAPENDHPGYGYDDDLATAQQKAMQDCSRENNGMTCVVSFCEKYTGPVLPIFSSCQSQW